MSYFKVQDELFLLPGQDGIPAPMDIEQFHGPVEALQEYAAECKRSCSGIAMCGLVEAAKTLSSDVVETLVRNDVLDNSGLKFMDLISLLRARLLGGELHTGIQPIITVNSRNQVILMLMNVSDRTVRTKCENVVFCPVIEHFQITLPSVDGDVVGDPIMMQTVSFIGESMPIDPRQFVGFVVPEIDAAQLREGAMQFLVSFNVGRKQYKQRAQLHFEKRSAKGGFNYLITED